MKKTASLFKPLLLANAIGLVSLALPAGAQSVWNAPIGVSVNTNWSSGANWSPTGVPGASTNVFFTDNAGASAPGIINNVVDANLTIQALIFRQTNTVSHNTLILPGVTLTISNSVAATNLWAGTEAAATTPTTLMLTNTISGAGGTLAITSTNVASVISVRETTTAAAGTHLQVLDMSGLDTFNASIGNLFVGVAGGTGTTRPQGQLFLAKTNNITVLAVGTKAAPSIDVGDTGSSPDVNNLLALGISNSIVADTIVIANQRSGSTLKFNSAFSSNDTPSLLLRGHSNARVTTFNIGDNSSATANIGSVANGLVDFSGGIVDVLVGSMTLGDGQPITGTGAGTATGTLTLTAGSINVNTVEVGFQNNTNATSANTGTLNVSGGTFAVNTSLRLALYGGAGGLTKGTINITNGTLEANTIVAGGGTSAINMVGGKLIVTNTIGSVATPLGTLVISGGGLLQLPVSSGAVPVEVSTLTSDNSGVINISSLPAITSYPSQPLPLIAYQNGTGVGLTFALGTLPSTFAGYITNDQSSTISVVITNGPNLSSITWRGNVNSQWDTTTLNWVAGGNPIKYQDLDVVTFDDSASTGSVTMTATFTPFALLQNNSSLNYTFSGPGRLTGVAGFTMNGTASVTLAETGGDNFSGGILVNAGKVVLDNANSAISGGLIIANGATAQIGNGDTNGALPLGSIDDEGTLIFNRTDSVLVASAISGAGALTQNGTGTLTLSVANGYSGNTTVNAGTFALTGTGSITNSPQINVTGGGLDISGVSGVTTLNNLNLANAGLTVSLSSVQTNFFVNSLTMGGSGNTISVTALPAAASYPISLTLVQSAGAISGFNMTVGTLPSGYSGTVAQSTDGTAVILTLTSGPIGVRANVSWVGLDALNNVNTNWSDRLNWQLPGAPVAVDNVIFSDTAVSINGSSLSSAGGGAAALNPANVNNIVDTNFAIASLTYTNNGGSYHNTDISSNSTLSITNFLTIGAYDSVSTSQQEFVNISGVGATLNVNNTNSNLQIWVGASGSGISAAALDLSALDNFSANISRLTVGASVNNTVNRPGGTLYLAKTNTLTCVLQATAIESGSTTANSGIVVGDCNQNAGPLSYIYLGQANTISADSIGIARQKSSAGMTFNPIYANIAPYPTVTFKGFTSGLVSNFDVGDGIGNTGTTSGTGDLNLMGGIVTATVDMMNVGRGSAGTSGTGTTTGMLEFDAGTITANTLNVGIQPATGSKAGVGTVTVGTNSTIGESGELIVNGTLNLGVNVGGGGAGGTSGTLNINGGTLQAGNLIVGTNLAQSMVSLNSGSLIINGVAGTPDAPITTLNLSSGTLQLSVDGSANVTNVVATSINAGSPITLQIGSLHGVTTGITYPLINYGSGDPFSSLTLVLPAGYSGSLVDDSTHSIVGLRLTVVPVTNPAHLTGINVNGTTLHINATGGTDGGRFVLLGTTNITTPLHLWTPVLTNNFDAGGNLDLSTNVVNPAVPQEFYILSQ